MIFVGSVSYEGKMVFALVQFRHSPHNQCYIGSGVDIAKIHYMAGTRVGCKRSVLLDKGRVVLPVAGQYKTVARYLA